MSSAHFSAPAALRKTCIFVVQREVATSRCTTKILMSLLTKRKYVYILLIMKEQQNQEVNMAKLLEVASFCVCTNLRKASRAVTQLYDESLQPTGLRATQYTLLVTLSLTGTISITDLARQLVMDRTTLTRNLTLIEQQGWVAIASGTDQRTRLVTLTKEGSEAVAQALPLWEEAQTRLVSELGRERWNTLLAGLSDVVSLAYEP